MPRRSDLRGAIARFAARLGKDPRLAVRAALGLLLVANLVAAAAVFRPWGGSPEELQRQLAGLRAEAARRSAAVERLRALAGKVERARVESDRFFEQYFLDRRTTYSAVVAELTEIAQKSGLRPKEHSVAVEPVEGSEAFTMLSITGHYEGAYADLIEFVNMLDRSPRFLTLEILQATPQQGSGSLNINLKLNAFVREEGQVQ